VHVGDVVLGLESSGLHSNGYSLVRKIVADSKLDYNKTVQEFGNLSLGEALLEPTRLYTGILNTLLESDLGSAVKAMSHITGGGIADNTARVIPTGLKAVYDRSTWALPIEMAYLAQIGGVPQADMERTWNCGIGMAAIVAPEAADLTIRSLAARGMKAWAAGEIQPNLTANNAQNGAAALEATFATR
jgi:phosphoribosylformylglycinamidine cyclo-ligase